MDKKQLLALKEQQEQAQDEAIDDLIGAVQTMKTGQKEIHKELIVQDTLLDNLGAGLDENSENISKVRRNLNKLL
jgi:thioredoxin-like negative regulator of GroEL